jgi:hypothetical protein
MNTRLGYFDKSLVTFAKPHDELVEIAKQIAKLLDGMPIGQALYALEKVGLLLGAGNRVNVSSPSYQEMLEASKLLGDRL